MNGLRLDIRANAFRGGYSGPAIRPGNSAESRLYQLITTGIEADGKRISMPPTGPLSSKEIDQIRQWIDQGAVWPESAEAQSSKSTRPRLWSFKAVERPVIPLVRTRDWVRNPLDAFILAKLEGRGIEPSPEAARTTLMRRLYLDLVGLPPDPDEISAFLADQRPEAYERLVDRLLASPHYGEKWARQWLDL